MNTTQELLTFYKASAGGLSDYKCALTLGIPRQRVCEYMKGRYQMGEELAIKVSELCGLDPAETVCKIKIETSNSRESRELWESILNKMQTAAALILLGFQGIVDSSVLPIF